MPLQAVVGGIWADLYDPIVRKWADQAFSRRPSLISEFFNVQGSNRAYEEVSGVGAIGIDAWDNYANAGKPSEVDFDQGYKKTYTHRIYGVDFSIDTATMSDNKHSEILKIANRIGDSAAVKREVDAASVFNNAMSASFLGADGVALCSDSHPLSPQKTGVTQDNNFALTLTKNNVATIREAMMAYTDDNGNKLAVTPNLLLVPPSLEDEARVITASVLDPDSANNAVNPQAGRFQVKTWHYLTSSTRWFMIDTNLMKQSLDWFNREPFDVKLRDGDDRTYEVFWRAYMRYSYGWSGWQWVAGSVT
jgi:hypothetical protein